MSEATDKSSNRPGLIKVIFDYPFHLGVPPLSFQVSVKAIGLLGVVKATEKEGAISFDKGKLLRRHVDSQGKIIKIGLDAISKTGEKTAEMVGSGKDDQPLFQYKAGEHGCSLYPWFYSELEIIFAVENIDGAWSPGANSDVITNCVIDLFNSFLIAYRHTSMDFHNQTLIKGDGLPFYQLLYTHTLTEEELKEDMRVNLIAHAMDSSKFVPYPMNSNDPDGLPIIGGRITAPLELNRKKTLIDQAKALDLLRGSGGAYTISLYRQSVQRGLEQVAIQKDYRISIVDFDTAVDMCVMYFITELCLKNGHKEEEIERWFEEESDFLTTKKRVRKLENILNENRVLKNKAKISLFGSSAYNSWDEDVRKKRNKGVHSGTSFKKEDSEAALKAAQQFIRFIEDAVIDTLA